jgi:hypothetical protein
MAVRAGLRLGLAHLPSRDLMFISSLFNDIFLFGIVLGLSLQLITLSPILVIDRRLMSPSVRLHRNP